MEVTRHFVSAAGLTLHYRRAGSGPPAVLLHESPRSSAALLPLMERLAPRFTVIGFDLPGFGDSDPLPGPRPVVADYARAIDAALDQLGLDRVPMYGTHTGAAIALDLARYHPDRVSVAILDGYPVFTPPEQENILRQYLPRFVPAWDGSHVATLWARVRDQYTFFPWYLAGDSARLPRDPPPLEHHHLVVMDYLRSGDRYRAAYAAAFRYDGVAAARESRAPVVYMAREDDILHPHLDRLPELPAGASIRSLGEDRDAWGAAVAEAMAAHPGQADPPAPDAGYDHPAGPVRRPRFLNLSTGPVRVRTGGEGSGRPLLLLHRIPGSADTVEELARELGRARLVIAPDLFGAGESAPLPGAEPSLEGYADGLLELVDALGLDEFDVVGEYTGGPFALALAARSAGRARRAALVEPPSSDPRSRAALRARYVPDLSLSWDGRHMAAAWWWVRDALLYAPWFHRRRKRARRLGPDVDLDALETRFVAALTARDANEGIARAAFAEPVAGLADRLDEAVARIDPEDRPEAARSGDRVATGGIRGLADAVVAALEEN